MTIPEGFTEVSDIPSGFTEVTDIPEGFSLIEEEDEGALKSFFRGARKVVQGAGQTLGFVSDEDYKRTFEKAKKAAEQHPIATGAGEVAGVIVPTVAAAALAPSVPLAAPMLAAGTAGGMIGGSEYARLGPQGENVDQASRLRSVDLASDMGMLGVAAPAAIGKTLTARVGSGVGINVALGGGERALQKDIALKDYPQLTPDVFDPTAVGLDVGFGALAGAAVHVGAKGEGKTTPDVVDPVDAVEGQKANLGTQEIVTQRKAEFEKQVEYATYKIQELEKSLQDPRNAQRTPEQAEQFKTAVIEQIVGYQKEIQALKQSIDNADAILRGETPAPRPEGKAEMPSSLPPRPEVDAFVRREQAPIPAEQARNADMFDQTVPREEIPSQVQSEMPLEQPRMPGEALPEQIGTDVPTHPQEVPIIDIKEPSYDSVTGRGDVPSMNQEVLLRDGSIVTVSPVGKEYFDGNGNLIEGSIVKAWRNVGQGDQWFYPRHLRSIEAPVEEITISAPRETGSFADIEADIPAPRPKGLVINGGSERIRSIVTDWVKRLGLDKEDIDFNIGNVRSRLSPHQGGNATVRPDSSVEINIKAADEIQLAIESSPTFGREIRALSAQKAAEFKEVLTAAHELGHILLGKLLQNDLFINGKKGVLNTLDGNLGVKQLLDDFAKWKEKKSIDEQRAAGNLFSKPQSSLDYYVDFPEFFAQRVTRELVIGKSSTSGPIAKFVSSIRGMIQDGIKGFGLSKAFERNVVDVFISNLIKANKESVAQFGKTIFEMQATSTSLADAWKWQAQHLYAKPLTGTTVGAGANLSNASMHIRDAADVIKEQNAVPDIAPLGTGTMFKNMRGLVNQGINAFTRNWFGIQQQAQIFSSSPAIRHTSEVILSSLAKQTQRSIELLSGVTDRASWDATRGRFLIPLQKIKDNLSFAVVASKSSNADFHAVHKVFEQGIGRYSYEESLARFGADLTPQQKTLFDTLSKMYGKMYKMAEGLEGDLGKKKIIPNMKGWYPAVRKGEFAVSFHIPGLEGIGGRLPTGEAIMTDLVYRQQFFSREEAQAFIEHFEKQSPEFKGRMQHNGVEELGKTDLTDNMAEFMRALEVAKEQLALEEGRGGDIAGAKARIQRLQDQYVVRGGTLGSHHKLRTNVPGAAGSEMFKDVGSAGAAFRDANFSIVEEYTRLMMKMEIGQKLDLLLNDEGLKGSHPETMAIVEQMRNYALNDVKSPLEMKGFKRTIDRIFTDTYTDKSKVRKALGMNKYRDTHLVDAILGKMSHLFYIHALMLRPAFWASQGSQFMWVARSLVKDGAGPVDAMTAAGKGFMTILKPDKDFLDGVFWQSQNTHTFSPQFINDLNKFHIVDFLQEGSKGRLLVDLATGEKQSTAADTFSRLMSYAMMHEHYKALGYTGKELWVAAGKATDENMVQYGRQYKAPIFQKAGMIGDLTSPLQTFSQAALGNLVADVGQILKTPVGQGKLKASMPFMMTMAITSLMAGVIGAPLVMEYEALRLALNYIAEKIGLEARLPSVIDIVLSGDNDFSHRVLSHGLISTSTMIVSEEGFDIATSNRWQPIISGIITGEKTFIEAMPTINFALQEAGYMIDLAGHIVGAKELTEAERRTAALNISPGMYKGLTNLLYDDESGVVYTQKGDAFTKNTTAEKASKFLGTSTITSSTERLRQRRTKEEDMREQAKINKKYELMADALQKGDSDRVKELATDLATNYHQTSRQIKSRMQSELFRRSVPAGVRQFVGKGGSMSKKQQLDYLRWQETYNDSPFEQDEGFIDE